jgi:hypothetical protein
MLSGMERVARAHRSLLHNCNSFSNGSAGHDPCTRNTSPGRDSDYTAEGERRETRRMLHLAVDVGGTFTDISLFDDQEGATRVAKVSSTRDPIDAVFSDVSVESGAAFTWPSAEGGGYGDLLLRAPEAVKEDVADGYVTPKARSVTTASWCARSTPSSPSGRSTKRPPRKSERASQNNRIGWLGEDPAELARRYQEGKIGTFELIRHHGVILDWGTGELLPKTTEGLRAMLKRRVVPHWKNGSQES